MKTVSVRRPLASVALQPDMLTVTSVV